MKIGIMQPYLFPYIGYFQLIKVVDTFVIYDDVNFIKQGWINKNRILLNGSDFKFTLILKDASSFKKINEIEISCDNQKLIKTIGQAYSKAPYYNDVFPIISKILYSNETNLAKYLSNSLITIIEYLNINTTILLSSEIEKNNSLKADEKVIDICRQLNATNYINAIGGQELYSKEKFEKAGLNLNFIKALLIEYPQFKNQFIPGLSIIDVMMFNSPDVICEMLNQYELI